VGLNVAASFLPQLSPARELQQTRPFLQAKCSSLQAVAGGRGKERASPALGTWRKGKGGLKGR